MKAFKKRPATLDDLRGVPETMIAELVDGELMASPRPSTSHSNVAGGLTAELRDPFQSGAGGPGGWWILYEPELHLTGDVLVPDFAGWRRERLPQMPDAPFLEQPPDWICEILSPSTAGFDRVRKMPVYLRERVEHVWLVDPAARTIEAFRLDGVRWLLVGNYAGTGRVRIEPFEARELDLSKLWLDGAPG